jgi:hypothetical protein
MRSLRLVLSLCLPIALSACVSATGTSDDAQTERGPLGKADAAGSCASDEGDFCGGKSDEACWCDDLCADYGDCCSDYEGVCLDEGGCSSNDDCDPGEFCSFDAGTCDESPTDGECAPMPEACIQVFAPVCGCDGQTYGNSCVASGNGVNVDHTGPCNDNPPDPPPGHSCEDNCGGKAGNCWCDDACTDYGDCCDDYEDWCVEEPPPPPPPPPPTPTTCDELEEQFTAETNAIRSCSTDAECGQVLSGTSCGCTRNWVARTNADTTYWESLRELAPDIEMGCNLPGTISTCDCPAVDGFACVAGTCSWNYL